MLVSGRRLLGNMVYIGIRVRHIVVIPILVWRSSGIDATRFERLGVLVRLVLSIWVFFFGHVHV